MKLLIISKSTNTNPNNKKKTNPESTQNTFIKRSLIIICKTNEPKDKKDEQIKILINQN